jgi:hypothetical protein
MWKRASMDRPTPEERAEVQRRVTEAMGGQFTDEQVRIILLMVESHVWRAGLWTRIRWAANVIGALGVIGGGAIVVASFFGYEVTRQ